MKFKCVFGMLLSFSLLLVGCSNTDSDIITPSEPTSSIAESTSILSSKPDLSQAQSGDPIEGEKVGIFKLKVIDKLNEPVVGAIVSCYKNKSHYDNQENIVADLFTNSLGEVTLNSDVLSLLEHGIVEETDDFVTGSYLVEIRMHQFDGSFKSEIFPLEITTEAINSAIVIALKGENPQNKKATSNSRIEITFVDGDEKPIPNLLVRGGKKGKENAILSQNSGVNSSECTDRNGCVYFTNTGKGTYEVMIGWYGEIQQSEKFEITQENTVTKITIEYTGKFIS